MDIYLRKSIGEKTIGNAEQKAKNLILDAENRAETLKKEKILEAKEEAHKHRSDAERDIREKETKYKNLKEDSSRKKKSIDRKLREYRKKRREHHPIKNRSITSKQTEGSGQDHAQEAARRAGEDTPDIPWTRPRALLLSEYRKGSETATLPSLIQGYRSLRPKKKRTRRLNR